MPRTPGPLARPGFVVPLLAAVGTGLLWRRWARLRPAIDAETRARLAPRQG